MFFCHLPLLIGLALCAAPAARPVSISILVTTDLHGNLYPYDYYTARPAERGLAKIATLIYKERQRNPNTMLVDCGDTIQGSPLESVYQHYVRTGGLPLGLAFAGQPFSIDPMMAAMNRLGYDAMVVGNHEYNYGLKNLDKARGEAIFPWISANTVVSPNAGIRPFVPYVAKTVAGVRIAVIGITTPAVPSWEKPENYRGLRFVDGVEAAREALAELRAKEKPDVVIVAAHAGLDRDPQRGTQRPGETGFENMVWQIAQEVQGIDVIVFGHTHQQLADYRIGEVLVHQPKNWGISLGRVDIEVRKEDSKWRVAAKKGFLLPVTAAVEADPVILSLAKPYHELTERFLNAPVAEAPAAIDGVLGRVADSAVVDAIHQVQLHYTKGDVSLTALFNPRVRFAKGKATVRQIAALYIYDNELYLIEGTGRMLHEALENAARYFNTCPDPSCATGDLLNRSFIGFNFDMAQGVDYEIDLTRPAGERIRNLRYHGKPLKDDQPLKIALNNYRAGGSAGYDMLRSGRVVWKSGEEIRNLMVDYYTGHKTLPAAPDGNWRIVPEAARRRLEIEALEEARRSNNF